MLIYLIGVRADKGSYSCDEFREMAKQMDPVKKKWLIRSIIVLGVPGGISFGKTAYKV